MAEVEKTKQDNTGQENKTVTEETKKEETAAKAEETEKKDAGSEAEKAGKDGSTAAAAEDAASSDTETKGFFKKKPDKEKQALKDQVQTLQDKVVRQMAEFDNYRKRTDKEKEQMFSMGEICDRDRGRQKGCVLPGHGKGLPAAEKAAGRSGCQGHRV